jgi:hypothetical protein
MGKAKESAANPLLDVAISKVARGLLIRRVLAE